MMMMMMMMMMIMVLSVEKLVIFDLDVTLGVKIDSSAQVCAPFGQ